jgi:hypothetical protein
MARIAPTRKHAGAADAVTSIASGFCDTSRTVGSAASPPRASAASSKLRLAACRPQPHERTGQKPFTQE